MGVLPVACIVLLHQLARHYPVLATLHLRLRLAGRLDLVFEVFRRCVSGCQQSQHVLDVAVGRGNEDLLQILEHLSLPALADLAGLAVHECGSNFVTAFPADAAGEGYVMGGRGVVEALDVYLIVLADVVLAEFSIAEVGEDGV